jgi:hypothetical protein
MKKYFVTLPVTVNVDRKLGSIVEKRLNLAEKICQ